ncbi:MAG: hypothetical protein WC478_00060 [Candidatus Omnitrophota bacterium]
MKSRLIILVVIILVALGIAGGGFYLYQQEHVRNVDLQAKLEDLTAKQKVTQEKLEEAERSLSGFEAKLKEATDQIDTLTMQLEQERSSKDEALGKIEQMRRQVDQELNRKSDLETKFNKAQDELKVVQGKLSAIEAEKVKLEARIKELETKSNVELGKIVVSPEAAAAKPAAGIAAPVQPATQATAGKAMEGKVLVLNKEYNFAVINLGSKDAVAIGDQFAVYQGNKVIGGLKVEKVQESMSAAGFMTEDLKDKVKEGDKVVKTVK